ncbi:MAG: oligosaccharide flippase family protein [Nanoarchaeota archaeon]|nr:oligosaccharide flippase family protein [Nanoarchaeota archaeon]
MIKNILHKIFPSELGRGAFILFVMINIFNILNFLFHFVMGRILGPSDYGILAVLMSLIYVYGTPSEAIQNLVAKYSSKLNVERNYGKIKFFMYKSLKKGFSISLVVFVLATIITFVLSKFLEINFWLIFITNVAIFFSIFSPIIRGVLQGRKKFTFLGGSMILEATFKLFFSMSLVLFGFKVFGAITGVLIGFFTGLIFAFYFNKDIIDSKKEENSFKGIYFQSFPYFATMFAIILFFSLDIIFARRFFSPELAGQYAVVSMLGKIIFLGTIAVSKAMFPLTSEKKEKKEDSFKLFRKSFIIVFVLCTIGVILYTIFPKIIISILYGKQYLEMYPYLVYSGLAFSFLSLSNLVFIYGLSINRLKRTYLLSIFVIIEVVMFFLFHNNILEYILAFMVSNITMFIGSLFFIKR